VTRQAISIVAAIAGLFLGRPSRAQPPQLLITHISVIDTHGGPLQPDMTVLVRGDRVAAVQRTDAVDRSGATVLDGRGKFLIPGLWDMEVHLSWATASALPVLIANGVTGVRDLGSTLEQIDGWRAQIATGSLIGPYILRAGPMLNGRSFNQYQMTIGSPEEARSVARTLKFLGLDVLSLERRVPRDSYFALMDEAKRAGIPVGGHVPIGITPEEAADAGQATVDNIDGLFENMLAGGMPEDSVPAAIRDFLASGRADTVFADFVRARTACTPALSQWPSHDPDSAVARDPRRRYVARSQRDFFAKHPLAPADLAAMERMAPEFVEVVGRMHHDGVTLLTGTDLAGPRIPGFSLHDELRALVTAGLTPLQALQAATLAPATVLGRTNDFGSVAAGTFADLVVLDANPLERIENTTRIAAVVLHGKLLRRDDLNELLARAQQLADRN
jgi:imidazolonepropionase-like amidohydrolase